MIISHSQNVEKIRCKCVCVSWSVFAGFTSNIFHSSSVVFLLWGGFFGEEGVMS